MLKTRHVLFPANAGCGNLVVYCRDDDRLQEAYSAFLYRALCAESSPWREGSGLYIYRLR
jgi:hypothetical protein